MSRLFHRLSLLLSPLLIAGTASAQAAEPNSLTVQRPTVVFQSGLGDGGGVWKKVTHSLEDRYPVFRYDRPGYGGVPAAEGARDPCAIARELHGLLAARGVKPPYVLVGHSLGGLYQYAFTRLYPGEVAGLVLVDPTHPRHWATMQREAPDAAALIKTLGWSMGAAARREFADQAICTDKLDTAALAMPVRILVKTRHQAMESAQFRAVEKGLQQDWLRLTGIEANLPVKGASHYIQRDRPQAVAAAIDAVSAQAAGR